MSINIGSRLRHLRLAHKLSQRELAKRTGVPNSTISLIESNASNPSVGALKRILDGIPIGLAEFFAFEPERPKKAFYAAEELVEIGKGAISYKQVGETLFGRSLQMLKECYQPGAIPEKSHLFTRERRAGSCSLEGSRSRSATNGACWGQATLTISTAGARTGFAAWGRCPARSSAPARRLLFRAISAKCLLVWKVRGGSTNGPPPAVAI